MNSIEADVFSEHDKFHDDMATITELLKQIDKEVHAHLKSKICAWFVNDISKMVNYNEFETWYMCSLCCAKSSWTLNSVDAFNLCKQHFRPHLETKQNETENSVTQQHLHISKDTSGTTSLATFSFKYYHPYEGQRPTPLFHVSELSGNVEDRRTNGQSDDRADMIETLFEKFTV